MLKYYRHGRLIYSLDGTVKEFPSINRAKHHVRTVLKPSFGEVLSNTPGRVDKLREATWKAAVKAAGGVYQIVNRFGVPFGSPIASGT